MSVSNDFKDRLTDLFEENGSKRLELSKEIGIDYRSFSNAINYGIVPKPIILMRIADFFNISIEYLLGYSDNYDFYKAKTPSNFHERVEELRENKKITYYKLSRAVNIDDSYFSRWKANKHLPSLELLASIAEYFNVSIDYLLGRTDDR